MFSVTAPALVCGAADPDAIAGRILTTAFSTTSLIAALELDAFGEPEAFCVAAAADFVTPCFCCPFWAAAIALGTSFITAFFVSFAAADGFTVALIDEGLVSDGLLADDLLEDGLVEDGLVEDNLVDEALVDEALVDEALVDEAFDAAPVLAATTRFASSRALVAACPVALAVEAAAGRADCLMLLVCVFADTGLALTTMLASFDLALADFDVLDFAAVLFFAGA